MSKSKTPTEVGLVQYGLGAEYGRIVIGGLIFIAFRVDINFNHGMNSDMRVEYRTGGWPVEGELVFRSTGIIIEEAVANMKKTLDFIIGKAEE